jgi:hypothetical protein
VDAALAATRASSAETCVSDEYAIANSSTTAFNNHMVIRDIVADFGKSGFLWVKFPLQRFKQASL